MPGHWRWAGVEGKASTSPVIALNQTGNGATAHLSDRYTDPGEMPSGPALPVGFLVTVAAHQEFMRQNRLWEVVDGLLAAVDVHEPSELQWAAAQMQQITLAAPVPRGVRASIRDAYQRLGQGPVTVRPWDVGGDPLTAFWVCRQAFLNIRGTRSLARSIKACWSSLFDARALFYREANGLRRDVAIAVTVQRMIGMDVVAVTGSGDIAEGNLRQTATSSRGQPSRAV